MKRLSTEEFKAKARQVHGKTFNYKNVVYVQSKSPVVIGCSVHGNFSQRPNDHLNGAGCPKCATDEAKRNLSGTTELFISRAKKKHKDKYDYTNSVYTRKNHKVEIICKDHGPFLQLPNDHVRGRGCCLCSRSRIRKSRRKNYKLGNSSVVVQGYEPQALDYLQSALGIKARDIIVGLGVPRIPYRLFGKGYLHFPDIFLPRRNTLVEVKSVYTFLLNLDALKRKRYFSIKAGFNYSVFIMDRSGQKVTLPKGWHLLSKNSLTSFLKRNKT